MQSSSGDSYSLLHSSRVSSGLDHVLRDSNPDSLTEICWLGLLGPLDHRA